MLISQSALIRRSAYVGRLAIAACVLAAAQNASAQANIPITVSGNQATGVIQLPGGIGAELTITFEDVVGLNPVALAVSASLVNPLDPILRMRLGGGGQIIPPIAFPVLIRIDPSPSSALTFSGTVNVSLHTHNLSLLPILPLGLHTASGGSSFHDMTQSEGIGSYRAGGTGGGFSEFLIVLDLRPINTVILGKFDAAQTLLNEHGPSIPGPVLADLQTRLTQARDTYQAGGTVAAIGQVTGFADVVRAHSGEIPDVWRAHDEHRVNVAGLLRAAADTLKFSLHRKANLD